MKFVSGKNDYLGQRNAMNISLERVKDTDWFWSLGEIQMFDELWFDGMPIVDMAKELRRSEVAVFLQSLDRMYRGKIKPREWKIW